MTVEILEFTPGKSPSVAAEVKVHLPKMHLTLARVKIIKSKAGNMFVAAPAYKQDQDSEEWCSYFTWGDAANKAFGVEVLEACQPYLANINNPDATPPPMADDSIPF